MAFTFDSLFGAKLQSKNGDVDTNEALSNKDAVAIYFSAHWCPPCRGFTPVCAEKYNQLLAAGKNFELVFASSDSDDTAFNEYYGTMPWLALPYAERDLKTKLAEKYACNGIPYLVILDGKTGEEITTNGRGAISAENFIENFPWYPKAMTDISESMDGIEGSVCFMLVQDCCDENVKKINNAKLLDFATSNDKSVCKKFFTANGGGPISFIKTEFNLASSTAKHKHDLVKCTEENPGPTTGAYETGWSCDVCRKNFAPGHVNRWICNLAPSGCTDHCDYCDDCAKKCEEPVPLEALVPQMVITNVAERKYHRPLEGKTDFNDDNLQQFLNDFKEGKCEGKNFASSG